MAQIWVHFALLGSLAACDSPDDSRGDALAVAAATSSGASFLPDNAAAEPCAGNGRLSTRLYGALAGDIEWAATEMRCQGMPRPDEAGARLRFSGEVDGGVQIAFIIAIPSLEEGQPADGLPSNVTIIEEHSSRFFSTPGLGSCWTDIQAQSPVGERVFGILGVLYCIAPLPEVNGDASVSIEELRFSGRLDWAAN